MSNKSSFDPSTSPCISMCRLESIESKQMTILQTNNLLDKDCINVELCISCGRTRDEIVNWKEYDINQKEIIFYLSNKRLLEKLGKI